MENERELATIPYIVLEVLKAKYQKRIKQLLWALAVTNFFWIILFFYRVIFCEI